MASEKKYGRIAVPLLAVFLASILPGCKKKPPVSQVEAKPSSVVSTSTAPAAAPAPELKAVEKTEERRRQAAPAPVGAARPTTTGENILHAPAIIPKLPLEEIAQKKSENEDEREGSPKKKGFGKVRRVSDEPTDK